MLFDERFWPGIADGSITVAFRRWKRPTVKSGGRLRCPVGELAIESVTTISETEITERDARRAGCASRGEVLQLLSGRDGMLYRIDFRLAGPDLRIALRERASLTGEEFDEVMSRLKRMDRSDPWTRETLRLIRARPATRAASLAASQGSETLPFKTRVRRLKDLGLTESLGVGYRLSLRGESVLNALNEHD